MAAGWLIYSYSVSMDTTSKKKGKIVPGVDWLSSQHVTQYSKLGVQGQTAQVTPRFFSVRSAPLSFSDCFLSLY